MEVYASVKLREVHFSPPDWRNHVHPKRCSNAKRRGSKFCGISVTLGLGLYLIQVFNINLIQMGKKKNT